MGSLRIPPHGRTQRDHGHCPWGSMSLDFPEYELIRKHKPFWGAVWRIADAGYYLSLFMGIFGSLVLLAKGKQLIASLVKGE